MKLPILLAAMGAMGYYCQPLAYAQQTPNRDAVGGDPNKTQETPGKPSAEKRSPDKPSAESDKPRDKDHAFIQTAGKSGLGEVKMAELAVEKGHSEEVKNLAAMLVKDHTQANQELGAIAKAKGIEIPMPGEKEKEKLAVLSAKSGADFDKAFLAEMKECHKKGIHLYEETSSEAKDKDLKAYIDKTLPVLRTHAEQVKKLHGKEST